MAAFDEIYYRFFKAAVGAYLSWFDCYNHKDLLVRSYCERWLVESYTWAAAAAALRPYMSEMKVRQLEGTVMGGKFTIGKNGRQWEVFHAAAPK